MKKSLLSVLATLTIVAGIIPTGFAEDVNPVVSCESGSLVIKVKKDFGALDYPADVTVTAYDKNGKLNFLDIIPVGTDGKLEFQYYNTGISGDYTFKFVIDSFGIYETATLKGFIGEDYWVIFCNDVNNLASSENTTELKNKILNETKLSLDFTKYNALADEQERDRVFGVMIADLAEGGYKSADEIKSAFEWAVEFVKYSEAKDSAGYYTIAGTRLGIPSEEDAEEISVLDKISKKARNAVFSAIDKIFADCAGEKQLSEEFIKNTLYTVISSADHYNDVKYVINAYVDAGLLDLDKDMKADIYKALMNNTFENEDEIKKAIKKATTSDKTPSSSGGGGGGGGFAVSTPVVKEPVEEPIKITEPSLGGKMTFSDMEDAKWALTQVESLCEKGILSGVGDGKFEPHRYVTREEFSKMLCSLGGFEVAASDIPFGDVSRESWAYDYVCTAYKNGIIKGVSDTEFAPQSQVTREQAVSMLYRILNINRNEEKFIFDDDGGISVWAKDAVYALREKGIVNGRTSKTFCPQEPMTRVEAAVLLYGAGEKVLWIMED